MVFTSHTDRHILLPKVTGQLFFHSGHDEYSEYKIPPQFFPFVLHKLLTYVLTYILFDFKHMAFFINLICFSCICNIAERDYWFHHVCLFNCLSAWNRLPLDRFSWNLMFVVFFENLWRKFKFDEDLLVILGALLKDICTFIIEPHQVLLKSEKCSRQQF